MNSSTTSPGGGGLANSKSSAKQRFADWKAIEWITLGGVIIAVVAVVASAWATNTALEQSNVTTIYTMGFDTTDFLLKQPALAKYLDKELRFDSWITEEDFVKALDGTSREERNECNKLWDKYESLSDEDKACLYLGCERIADFTQIAFMQRDRLSCDDWNTWWEYLTDQYDESPFYRVFLAKRPTWYSFEEHIKVPNRNEFFR